ncbi:lactonase family protein [uncultured Mucilaginibacter sp.]|uniref:lactonase family protein n=1 Tax=uncultured Mucilaginibacter sp. TaxID=797541 RepID=UPI0025F3E342|nr:lactonase family protein [uncultured Mucilaginibacter sp.]
MKNLVFNLIIGSYTEDGTDGLYVYRFDAESGKLSFLNKTAVPVENPTYLCISANNRFVYTVNEVGIESSGYVSAFSFDANDGTLHLLNTQHTGPGPCHVTIDGAHKHLFVANYEGGSVYVFPINEDGSLAPVKQIIQEHGSGPNHERQDKSHVHIALLSADEDHLVYTDLGADNINIRNYNPYSNDDVLVPVSAPLAKAEPGEGPRHVVFSPDNKNLYLVNEMSGNVTAFKYDNGTLEQIQKKSMLPDGFDGEISGGDIRICPNGRFVYASNRGDANEIIVFERDFASGLLTFVQRQDSGGKEPRNLAIDPTGGFLLSANQKSNNIVVFKINGEKGELTPARVQVSIRSPSCLKFSPVA